MDEASHIMVLMDPSDCGRKLVPWLRRPGGRIIRIGISPNGIHREAALWIVPRGPRPRTTTHRRTPRPPVGRHATRQGQALILALPALISDLLGIEGQDLIAQRAKAALLRFPGVLDVTVVLYDEYRSAPRVEGSSTKDPWRLGPTHRYRRRKGVLRHPLGQRVVLSLLDRRHTIGFIELTVTQEALRPAVRYTLLAAGRSLTSVLERERWRTRLERLHDLHSRRTAELSAEIAERQRTEQELRRFSIAIEQSGDSVFITDTRGIIRYVNKAFETTTGYGRDEAIGRTPRILRSGRHARAFYSHLWRVIRDGSVYRDVFVNRRKDGSLYYEETTITPLRDHHGLITYYVSTGKDITEHLATEERIQYLANHDPLTNLPTRALFAEKIDQAVEAAMKNQQSLAILLFDLDRFRRVNDTFGPLVGDQVVQEFSHRLRTILGKQALVARIGGDGFAALFERVQDAQEVSVFADHIAALVADPFVVDGHEFFLTISVGVSLFPDNGQDAQTLIRNAGSALNRAKRRGGNAHEFYTTDMNARALERLTLESRLRRALERDELCLFYQPQKDINTGHIIGVEALMRWQQPDGVIVGPAGFIPLMEETGLIVPVGEWALRAALAQRDDWRANGFEDIRVSVNISGRQFRHRALLATLADILEVCPDSDGLLELELTESVLMENAQGAIDMLEALSEMGVRLAVDDFGTGYSSLSYLKRFPLNALKIDQSFVSDLGHHGDGGAITNAIITLGHELGLEIVAEGVETDEQMSFLRRQHCDFAQGYLVGRPLSGPETTELFRSQT